MEREVVDQVATRHESRKRQDVESPDVQKALKSFFSAMICSNPIWLQIERLMIFSKILYISRLSSELVQELAHVNTSTVVITRSHLKGAETRAFSGSGHFVQPIC